MHQYAGLDLARRVTSRRVYDLMTQHGGEFSLGTEDFGLERKDAGEYVQSLIQQLALPYRTVLTLYYLEEMSYAEMVKVMDMPEGTVKNYLFRAKKKLQELMEPLLEKEIGLL